MRTVFLFAAHRIFLADLLRGDYLGYLASRYRVVVFLPAAEHDYPVVANVTYLKFPLTLGRFWSVFDSYLRPYLIRRFDYLPGVQFRYANYKGTDRIKNFLRWLALALPDDFFSPRFLFWLERIFLPRFDLFKSYVQHYQPALVLTATPGLSFADAWAILAARRMGLPSAAVNFSWDNLTVYPRSVRPADYLICWNEVIKEEAVRLHGYRPERVFVSGVMRFDHYFRPEPLGTREEFLISKNLDPRQKTVLVATATDPDPDLHRQVIRRLRKLGVNIIVRVHPLERLSAYDEFQGAKNVRVELAGSVRQADEVRGWQVEESLIDRLNTKKLFSFCDLHINRSSTFSLESLIFDLPVINFDFGTSRVPIVTFPHYQPLIAEGAVFLARNLDELVRYAKIYLADPSLDRENRKQLVSRLVPFQDGLAYKRNVDFLAKILHD